MECSGCAEYSGCEFCCHVIKLLTGGRSGMLLFMTYHSSLLLPMTWIRMFTHIFGHADWSHLIGNMSYLLLLGPMLEEKYSSRVLFLEVVLVTAFVTDWQIISFSGDCIVRCQWSCVCLYTLIFVYKFSRG